MTAGALGHELGESPARPDRRDETALPFPFFDILDWFFSPAKRLARRPWPARRLFALAAGIAGSRRAALRSDWSAVLAESSRQTAVRAAGGMVVAALRLRAHDAARAGWRLLDRILASRTWSNLAVAAPTTAAAWVFFRHGGGYDVLVNTEAIAVIGAAFRKLVTLGRWWRDVAPPKRRTAERALVRPQRAGGTARRARASRTSWSRSDRSRPGR